jgi:imidazolonepropionase-like amidohydrolase
VLADQQMDFLKGEFRNRFKDLQDDFEAKSEELKTLLSEAHTHALVTAHSHGEDDVKAMALEHAARIEVLTITQVEKIKMLESLNEIKLDTQKNEFLRKLEHERDSYETELMRARNDQGADVTQLKEVDCSAVSV